MMKRALLACGVVFMTIAGGAASTPAAGQVAGQAGGQASPHASRRPNVVLIVADDLGYADVGCQGQSKDVNTPNLDSIAKNGVRFTNGYVSGPVCSPTRAGLLTGRYQQRFGFEQNPQPRAHDIFGLPLDEVLLPQQMKKAGYVTGMIGKWHLGSKEGMPPHQRGFDEFFGFWGGAHRYINNDAPQTDDNAVRRGGEPVAEKEHLTAAFTREAVSFIDRHKDKPFFLYLPYNAVHSPMQAQEKNLARFPDETEAKRRAMLAMLAGMDDGVGQVLAKLREHKLDRDTLVIFHSDNGGPTQGNGSLNTPLRGRKGETLEGGIRVPFMMQWIGRLPAGKVEDRVVIQLDVFPTVLAAAGGELPEGRPIDGKNLIPFLTGENKGAIHESIFWRFGPRRAIRSGDWKLHWNGDETPHLYDLAKDLGEANDVAAANPQVAERLLGDWRKWDAQLMKPRWPGRLEGGAGGGEAADVDAGEGDQKKPATRPRSRRRP